ncbi:MAG: hypothetical protein LCH70_07635 [Proteobacteria bacterium]|nr:hypothetical protein [Pseudomonadota bacterium]
MNPNLRDELAEILREGMQPSKIVVLPTGETFSSEALALARFYDKAIGEQRYALRTVAEAFGASIEEDHQS